MLRLKAIINGIKKTTESIQLKEIITVLINEMLSVVFLIPFIMAFKRSNYKSDTEKYFCRLFLYIAILILIISVFDVLWFNPGVIK